MCKLIWVYVCDIDVTTDVRWLTSDEKQDQDKAAQGQREVGREKKAEDSAPDSPHCVLIRCVCVNVCVGLEVHVWSMAPLWPCLPCYRKRSPRTHTHTTMLPARVHSNCSALLQCIQTEHVSGQLKEKTLMHHNPRITTRVPLLKRKLCN